MLKLTNIYCQILLLALAGAFSVFAFAPFYISALIFICLVVFISLIEYNISLSFKRIIGLTYIFAMMYFMSQLYWVFYSLYYIIHAQFIIALIALVGFSLFLASYFVLAIIIYKILHTKYNWFNLVLLLPSIWVLFEWLRGWLLGGFPWCDIGYSQSNVEILRGFYPVIGEYGVSWLCMSLAGSLFYAISVFRQDVARDKLLIALAYMTIVLLCGNYLATINYTVAYGKPISVALIQGNIPEGAKWNNSKGLKIYASLIKQAKADLVLIPETAIAEFPSQLPKKYLTKLTNMAKHNKANLIIGIPLIIDKNEDYVNSAMVLTQKNHPYYAKYHLVPYGEYIPAPWLLSPIYRSLSLPMVGFTPGQEFQPPIVIGNQKVAFNICYENGYSSELLYSAKQSTLMINLSDMVWYGTTITKDQHLQLSQVRALENQRYYIQETNTGDSAIINPYGEIHTKIKNFTRTIAYDYVQGRVGYTPFEHYGNYLIISFASIILMIAVLFWFI